MRRPCLILLACLLIVPSARAQDDGRLQSIAFLQKLQDTSGGFLPAPAQEGAKSQPTLRATSAAIRAIHYLGGKLARREACVLFVKSCHDAKTGAFRDTPQGKGEGEGDVFTTAVGIMAVKELELPADRYFPAAVEFLCARAKSFEELRIAAAGLEAAQARCPRADDWLRQVLADRNFDGSYGADLARARQTAGSVVTILRLGGEATNRRVVLTALREGQLDNGGYGAGKSPLDGDLESTYRVMRAFKMLHDAPTSLEGIRSFVAKCRNEDGGYGLRPGEPSAVGPTYHAAIVTRWVEEMQKKRPKAER